MKFWNKLSRELNNNTKTRVVEPDSDDNSDVVNITAGHYIDRKKLSRML